LTELQQKQQRVGRTRRALRAISDFVDRRLTTKTVIAATILVLLASWIYPPWILGSYRNASHGWFFVFDTTRDTTMRVDFGRLFLIDAIIAAVGGLLAWAVFRESTSRRVIVRFVFYALFAAFLIAVVGVGTVLIQGVAKMTASVAQKARETQLRAKDVEFVKRYRKAAERGDAYAQTSLGLYYSGGQHGLPQDFTEATRWYNKAAEQGDAVAQNNLGVLYANGEGVPSNFATAVEWYRKAAEQGEPYAENNLGICLLNGRGAPKDVVEAYVWLSLAAAQGNAGVRASLGSVASQLDHESTADAQRRAAEFVPNKQGKDNHSRVSADEKLSATPSVATIMTLVKSVAVQTKYGTITIEAGTNLQFISRDGDNVRFHYGDTDYEIPVDATDLAK